MFKNYFKIAWRNLFRNKGFSVTNILGLTIGITCTILILLWVQDELGFDKFHASYGSIYKVMANRYTNNDVMTDEAMVFPLAPAIEKELPQVKYAVVRTGDQRHVLSYGETKLKKTGYTVSGHFFDMFTWKFISGNAATAITDPSSLVLTESSAKALFGNDDPVNKMVRVDNAFDMKVTAVVADIPGNSSLRFDFIMPFNYSSPDVQRSMGDWRNSSWSVYLQMLPGADRAAVEKKINEMKLKHDPDDKISSKYFTYPMSQWHLYSDFKNGKNVSGMIEYVKMFSVIAVIILLIACVNFMNLSTARSEKRAKEVGVRKTLGSDKTQLIFQFFTESMILACIAFLLSVFAVYLLLPLFNDLVNKHLVLDLSQPIFWIGAFIIIAFTGIVAGSYPALYLSSFNPVKVLKGTFLTGKAAVLPRHILVVAQFVISILLISSTIIVYQQIQHIKDRQLGYDPNNLIEIPASPDTQKNYEVIKNELIKTGLINAVTRTFSPITDIWWRGPSPEWAGKPANLNILFAGMASDIDFTKTMGIKMLQGKDFTGTPGDSASMLLNKAAIEAMGLKNPIGMKMHYNDHDFTVIGVTDNVIMGSPFEAVDPMMVYYVPGWSNYIDIRLNQSSSLQKSLSAIEPVFKKYNPAYPFEYQFADKEFAKKFISEDIISKITNVFACLAILICCIGLAGLASFTIEKRFREIGIRKVLGASVQQVLAMISKEFLKLVAIAFVIAVPLTWWLMTNWLQKYTYRIGISVWLFAAVGVLILLLTIAVVVLNTIRAAVANPVKSLRSE
ncbi:MAG: ABC transporter permease [Bacteroidetes bacterium]|nr:ABC transporter permease [Bacteroidota bacterium]